MHVCVCVGLLTVIRCLPLHIPVVLPENAQWNAPNEAVVECANTRLTERRNGWGRKERAERNL